MGTGLTRVHIRGFKSIEDQAIAFGPVNVMIGPNGSGKSNLIAFFRMLSHMLAGPTGNLRLFVGAHGGANGLLFDGAKQTPQLEAEIEIATDAGENDYGFRLFHVAGDSFLFAEEKCRFSGRRFPSRSPWIDLGAGHSESKMVDDDHERYGQTIRVIRHLLTRLAVYQFHDTSQKARIKQKWPVGDARYLKEDAGNLGAFLFGLRVNEPRYYKRIVETIRQIVPFFDDFILEPEYDYLILKWRERGSDVEFGAHQASDGMLRAMALITLLLQPPDKLPAILALDEPELGLHPYAVTIISGLIGAASQHSQVLIATQSPSFLDQFAAEDVVVVDRVGRATAYRRLREDELRLWLDEYRLSELWNMNMLGGRPKEVAA